MGKCKNTWKFSQDLSSKVKGSHKEHASLIVPKIRVSVKTQWKEINYR